MPRGSQLHVRRFQQSDAAAIVDIGRKTLPFDPLSRYICHVGRRGERILQHYVEVLLRWSICMEGVIDVICTPVEIEGVPPTVVGAAIWLPLNRRPSFSWRNWLGFFSLDLLAALCLLGFISTKRLFLEYPFKRAESRKQVGLADASLRKLPSDSWALELALLDCEYQKRGLESILINAHRARSKGPIFVDVSRPSARDYFRELGFELLDRYYLGKGEVDTQGLPVFTGCVTGSGIEVFSLIQREE
ncbi:hypothetical protein FA15DRAFT_664526 [Coprinopsis marcescibilis]|uniref:N-acetyltransferase domain-containing protein n=1 Tax=Coprinopsis marcescibilis TaxID=230819 RepID=A0A5C3L841_COPMA|nr:hypothetical protein FA15DRAFT_664526 [Coprinopsis marcescibilis]